MVVAAEGVEKPPGYDRKTDKDGLLMRAISTERVIAALDKIAA
jgi:hypothetical protein